MPAEQIDIEKVIMLQFGVLLATCNTLCHIASKNLDDFIKIRNEIFQVDQ